LDSEKIAAADVELRTGGSWFPPQSNKNAGQTGKEEAGLTDAVGHLEPIRILKGAMYRRINRPHRRRTPSEQLRTWTLLELKPASAKLQFKESHAKRHTL
jgi:hypothetical protein